MLKLPGSKMQKSKEKIVLYVLDADELIIVDRAGIEAPNDDKFVLNLVDEDDNTLLEICEVYYIGEF